MNIEKILMEGEGEAEKISFALKNIKTTIEDLVIKKGLLTNFKLYNDIIDQHSKRKLIEKWK